MKIKLSHHAYKRITQARQNGIELFDVYKAAKSIPIKIKQPGYRIKNNISRKGKKFDVTIVDYLDYRLVTTIIGYKK